MTIKKCFKIVVFYFCMIVVILVITEISLRIFGLFSRDSRFFCSDQSIGYRMRPNVAFGDILTNQSGFNDINRPLAKEKDVIRAAFIGDSITFGLPRGENFVTLVEQKAKDAGIKLETLNMGIPGADPGVYLGVLKNDAVDMQSDIAVIMFFIGNDIIQSNRDFQTKIQLGQPKMLLKRPWKVGFSGEYWYVCRFWRVGIRLITELARNKKTEGTFARSNFLEIEKNRLSIYRIPNSSFIKTCYSDALMAIEALAIEAKKRNMKIFVVLVPDEVQLNNVLQKELFCAYRLDARHYDFQLPQWIIKRHLADRGILCLDLMPAFKRDTEIRNASLYLKQDTHWNSSGHSLAATEIFTYMRENKLL